MKTPIGLSSLLLVVALIGCSSSFQLTSTGSEQFQASTETVEFGTVTVGQAADSSVTLVNHGLGAIQIADLNVTGNGFTATSPANLPISVAANGGTYVVSLHFKPKANGDATGNLTITNTSLASPSLKIKLHGKGADSPALSSFSCGQSLITGSASDTCTVTLNAAAGKSGVAVSLASNNPAVMVPASVTVVAGSTSAGFSATVSAVSSTQTGTLTATAGSVSKTFAIELHAIVPTLSALSCTNSSMTGSGTDACTVTLSGAAPSGGTTVTLAS
ncbi:MAG: choice-of-anchor D domain-containing protein, partial [Terracidiphilus sp.]